MCKKIKEKLLNKKREQLASQMILEWIEGVRI